MPAARGTHRRVGTYLIDLFVALVVLLAAVVGNRETDSDESGRAAEARHAVWAHLMGLQVSVIIALGVILNAIDVQSGLVADSEGHAWSFSTLFGPQLSGGLHRQGWTVLTTPGQLTAEAMNRFSSLLSAHLVVDLIYVAVYAVLLLLLVRALCQGWWRRVGLSLLGLLVIVDLVEDLLAALVIGNHGVLGALLVLTTGKWIVAAALAVVLLLRIAISTPRTDRDEPRQVPTVRSRIRRAGKAVVHQRFSYAPVLAIFLLSIPSGAAILEQLPDAQRQWVFDPDTGTRQAVAAISSTLVLGLFILAVGRRRTIYALRHPNLTSDERKRRQDIDSPSQQSRRHLVVWLVGPALAALGAGIILLGGQGALILGWRLLIWILLPVLIVVASVFTLKAWRSPRGRAGRWFRPDRPLEFGPDEAFAVGIAGTVAGVGAIVVGGLSLLRALAPLVVLPVSSYIPDGADPAQVRTPTYWLLVISVIAIVTPWLVMIAITRRYGGPSRRPLVEQPGLLARGLVGLGRWLCRWRVIRFGLRHRAWLLLGGAIAVYVGLGILPRFAAWIGLAATATLALGSLAGMLSGVGLVLQDRPTAEIFRLLRLRRTPLITLLVITVILVSAVGGRGGIHQVDLGQPVTAPPAARPSAAAAFSTWLSGAQQCQLTVAGFPIRPMLMIAAEGGGIRASYWTVRGLQAIDDSTCAGHATFLSGGASGGSVGLSVARFSGSAGDTGSRAAVDAVKKMAKPATLSEAADGTFVRDLIYGATGLPVPRVGEPHPFSWQDRARLMERGWVASGDWGARSFLTDPAILSPSTGALIINSTSVKGNCRVWLSQLQLPAPAQDTDPTFDPELNCDKVLGVAPRTIDLFSAYGPYVTGASARTCFGQVSAATAALLTARFPYVTPSGVVGPCPDRRVVPGQRSVPYWPETQLVDGGYIEDSGLATITDLSDVWLPLVREQNRKAFADSSRKTPLVVPLVVYLTNEDRNVNQPALDASPISELAVPPTAYLAAGHALGNNDAQLGRARDVVALSGFCPTDVQAQPCAALEGRFPSRVVVVDRATQPEIGAPLGWVLSGASITSLDKAMLAQLNTVCPANRPAGAALSPPERLLSGAKATCRPGYATLGDLKRYLSTERR